MSFGTLLLVAELLVCASCRRHVEADAARCPFCGGEEKIDGSAEEPVRMIATLYGAPPPRVVAPAYGLSPMPDTRKSRFRIVFGVVVTIGIIVVIVMTLSLLRR